MRYLLIILFFLGANVLHAQTNIEADIGDYVPAENYGDKAELKRFLQQEMLYPDKAYKNKIQGTVELVFAVDSKTGETSQLKVKKSVEKSLDEEAIRLFKMLLFKPSYYKGNKVTTFCSLKVKFSVKAYNKYCKKRGYTTIDLENPKIDYSYQIIPQKELDVISKVVFQDTLMTLHRFTYDNLKYPEGTLKMNIKGIVKIQFIVEPTGRITNINALKTVGGGATKEAERILKLLIWTPAMKDGKYVRALKTFEVKFNLSNESDFNYVPSQM